MKLTKSQLKQIIKEELTSMLKEDDWSKVLSRRKAMAKMGKTAAGTLDVAAGGLGLKGLSGDDRKKSGLKYPQHGGESIELDPGESCNQNSDCKWNEACDSESGSCRPHEPEEREEKRKQFGKKYEPKKGEWTSDPLEEKINQVIEEELLSVIHEHAKNYVWGVKGPNKVANQYRLKLLKHNLHNIRENL